MIISTRDARLLAKDMSSIREPKEKLRGGYPGAETKPDRTVDPGDRVGSLEVIAAPGHTPDMSRCSTPVTARSTAAMSTRPSAELRPRRR